jgi:hypothetical protein
MNSAEGFMVFPYTFITPTEIMIEETEQGVAMISGTLLKEGISRNGNLYTIEEMENIAKQAQNKPIYYGVTEGINPNTGLWSQNLHDESPENRIGKIIKTTLDKIKRKITFIAEVVNTTKFPDIINKIKAGWGISIGGYVTEAHRFFDKVKGLCLKIKNMIVEHVSLIDPSVVRGQDEAKVESVKIQETMLFDIPKRKVYIFDSTDVKAVEYVR